MTFEDKLIRLKILKYLLVEFTSKDIWEWHFIKAEHAETYMSGPPMWVRKRQMAFYIYDCKNQVWTKQYSPLDAMPLTEAERVLYANHSR